MKRRSVAAAGINSLSPTGVGAICAAAVSMKNRFAFVLLLAASLALVACGDREVASSATAPDATLAPSIPTDNTGWSSEPSTAASTTAVSSTVDTSTMTPPAAAVGTTPTPTDTAIGQPSTGTTPTPATGT